MSSIASICCVHFLWWRKAYLGHRRLAMLGLRPAFRNQEVVPQSLGTIEIGSPLWCGPLHCDGLTDVVVDGGPNGIMAWGRRSRQSDAVVTYRRLPNDYIR